MEEQQIWGRGEVVGAGRSGGREAAVGIYCMKEQKKEKENLV